MAARLRRLRVALPRPLLAVCAMALLAVGAHSQVANADYAGSRTCLVCHRAKNKAIVEGYLNTAHAKAMQIAGDDTIVADFTAAPFTKDQVAYTLGKGRHKQAYLDQDLKVLPGTWLVEEKKWEAHESVDGSTECVGCHVTGYNPADKSWKDIGVSCEMCHGPGSVHKTAKADERNSTIVRPQELDASHQSMICGRCHSAGRSVDGKYAWAHDFRPGQDLAASFKDAKPTKPGPNQQLSELMQSPKHWANGVSCEKCHDPHGETGLKYQLRMPINETCLQCHKDAIVDIPTHTKAKGVTPAADATCATCHMPNGQHLFDKSITPK